jgi:hypothetical protein
MIRDVHPGSSDQDLDFFTILDPGSRGQKVAGSRIRIRNTAINITFLFPNNKYEWIPIQYYDGS